MPELIDNALTTLERVKEQLNIEESNTDSDNMLINFINEASDFIVDYTGFNFAYTSGREEVLGGSSDNYLILKHRPVAQINSIMMGDTEITDYEATEDDLLQGMIYRDLGWNKSTYSIRGLTGDQFGSRRLYTVNYDYGYVLPKDATEQNPQTLPRSVENVAVKLAISKYQENNRDSYGLKELKQGRLTYKFSESNFGEDDLRILKKYRTVGVW